MAAGICPSIFRGYHFLHHFSAKDGRVSICLLFFCKKDIRRNDSREISAILPMKMYQEGRDTPAELGQDLKKKKPQEGKNMDIICNSASINGVIASPYYLAYTTEDGQCYKVFVKTMRLSGTEDTVPVIVPELCLEDTLDGTGRTVSVTGTFQSRNHHADGKNHLDLFLYADSFVFEEGDGTMGGTVKDTVKDNNRVILEGFLCKAPVYRKTLSGREITDLLVAVNAPDPKKANYIPCIAWCRKAVMAGGMHTGDCVRLAGRIQSREYIKRIQGEDGEEERRMVAYEISCKSIQMIAPAKGRTAGMGDMPEAKPTADAPEDTLTERPVT